MASDSVVNLANKLLQRLDISYRLSSAEQCDSTLFIETFSKIVPRLGGEWPEKAAASAAAARHSRHESQSRIQLILDTLLAMLSTDLSHINAKAVVDGDLLARTYLLEIFIWVLDYLDEVSRKLAVPRGAGMATVDDSATQTLLSTPSLSFTSLSSDSSQSFEITTQPRDRRSSSRRSKKRNSRTLDTAAATGVPVATQPRAGLLPDAGSGSSSGSLYSVSDLAEADISSAESRDGRQPSERRGPHHVLSAADISISSIASDTSKGSYHEQSTTTGNPSTSQQRSRRRRHHRQWDGDVVAGAPGSQRRDKAAARPPSSAMGSPPRDPAQAVDPVSSTPKKPTIARRIDYSLSNTNTSGSSHLTGGSQTTTAALRATPAYMQPPPTVGHDPVATAGAPGDDDRLLCNNMAASGAQRTAHRRAATRQTDDVLTAAAAAEPPSALHRHAKAAPLQSTLVDSSSAGLLPRHYHTSSAAPHADASTIPYSRAVGSVAYPPPAVGLRGYYDADATSRGAESVTGSTSELLRDLPSTGMSGSASLNTTELLASQELLVLEAGRARSKPQSRPAAPCVATTTEYTHRHAVPGAVEGNSRAAAAVTTAVGSGAARRRAAHSGAVTQSTLPSAAPVAAVPVTTTTVLNTTRSSSSYPHAVTTMFTSATGSTSRHQPAVGSSSTTTTAATAAAAANHHRRHHRAHATDHSTASMVSTGARHGDSNDSVRPRATDSAPSFGGHDGRKRVVRSDDASAGPSTEARSSGRSSPAARKPAAVSTSSRAAAIAAASRHSGAVTTRHAATATATGGGLGDEQRSARGAVRDRPATHSSLGRKRDVSPVSHPGRRSAKPSDDALLKSPLRPTGGRHAVTSDSDVEVVDSEAEFTGSEYSDAESPPRTRASRHSKRQQARSPPPRPIKSSAAGERMTSLNTGYRKELSRFRRRTRSMTGASAQTSPATGKARTTAARKSSATSAVDYGLDGRRIAKKPTRLSTASSARRPASVGVGQSLRGKSAQASKRTSSHRRTATATSTTAAAAARRRGRRSQSPLSESHDSTADQQSGDEENSDPVALSAGILPVMVDRFPHIQVTRQTAQRITQQHNRQMKAVVNQRLEDKTAPDRPAKLIAEAERRQAQVVHLLKKEISHNQRLQDQRDAAARQREVTARLREKRHASARAHRYYNDFELQLRSKLAKQRNTEEQIFRKLFEDGLALQRSRIRELRSYAKEKGKEYATKLQDDIDSMENYYRDQFSMLAEVMDKERKDEAIRQTEQAKAVDRLKRELRKKMESDITRLQEALDHGEEQDAAYVRQLEADRLRHDMHMFPGPMPL